MLNTIVLDLDECLVCVYTEDVNWNVYNELRKDVSKRNNFFTITVDQAKYWGVKRPHLRKFLLYCFNTYKNVCVWSAGRKPYVHAVVDVIFRGLPKPKIIMTRDDVFYQTDYFYCKPLERLFEQLEVANPQNTILVDNQLGNSKYDPHNIVHIPDFEPQQSIELLNNNDDCLLYLIRWLKYLESLTPTDIRDIYKRDIFSSDEVKLLYDFEQALAIKA